MPGPSIAIAGGGLIGLSIAWRLAQHGYRVALYEKAQVGGEASWAGAGMLAPGGELDQPSPLVARALESRALYRAFVRELESSTGVAVDYQECGGLDLAYAEQEWLDLQTRAERQATFGVASKKLNPGQVAIFWPRVRTAGLCGALFYPDDAIVNPRDLVLALSLACRQAGVEIIEQTTVKAVRVAADGAFVECAAHTRLYAAVVIAAGAWSSQVAVSNVPPLPPSEPIKGHLVGYQQPDQTCNTIIRHAQTYLLQRSNGLLIAGASVERVGWDRRIDSQIAALLANAAASILPHLAETTPSETWIGFRPASDDLHVGAWHSRSIYLAYGHYRNGILLAPLTAQEIARQVIANWGTPMPVAASSPPPTARPDTSA